ncbi:hypothetical protein [Vibrio campbellii]|uniref:H-NS family histone-like protein n=1 Tax=Vibrio campbellii TaxID=680 RepID=UPI000CD35BE4|nr:hypothetical protein [Vibrio campbellii]AUW07433.1 hypothetical protein C1N51_27650 [Vibrio campbellii]
MTQLEITNQIVKLVITNPNIKTKLELLYMFTTSHEKQEELVKLLSNQRSVDKLLDNLYPDEIEKIINRLNNTLESRRKSVEEEAEQRELRSKAIDEFLQTANELGISIAEVTKAAENQPTVKINKTGKLRKKIDKVYFVFRDEHGNVDYLYRTPSGLMTKSILDYAEQLNLDKSELIVSKEIAHECKNTNTLPEHLEIR